MLIIRHENQTCWICRKFFICIIFRPGEKDTSFTTWRKESCGISWGWPCCGWVVFGTCWSSFEGSNCADGFNNLSPNYFTKTPVIVVADRLSQGFSECRCGCEEEKKIEAVKLYSTFCTSCLYLNSWNRLISWWMISQLYMEVAFLCKFSTTKRKKKHLNKRLD